MLSASSPNNKDIDANTPTSLRKMLIIKRLVKKTKTVAHAYPNKQAL